MASVSLSASIANLEALYIPIKGNGFTPNKLDTLHHAITEGQLGNAVELMIKIQGIDEHYSKCQLAGIIIITPPTDHFYGERQYTIKDIGGHFWTLSETIKDLLPEDWGATSKHID
ncbi:hypothetical protein A4D02_28550 [Niastella koreensis]|uniref:Glyoxalase/bleomycin resistance protein/dioxygenase n=2 Tax=Niastella koreensis TaxID=354356 RepID=G8T8H6_NIAKG|nr:hypothetical protein [Niastella koreensis]AEW00148.1 hypothetical protein Niako_3858 [Niastella koreensis GR20-10]OQP49546.1 hypothetical protein A4D02_28550 [Niastella koreensis]